MKVESPLQTVLRLCGFWLWFTELSHGRLVKRIIDGEILWTQDEYDTYHFIHIREAFACTSIQGNHDLDSLDCQERGICGGTLFTPEFVITAAHCVSYKEFYLRTASDVTADPRIQLGNNGDDEPFPLIDGGDERFFDVIDRDVRVAAIRIRRKHIFYSNIALFAGDTYYFQMTQKRHGYQLFFHPDFAAGPFSVMNQDIALVQVCEPFEITASVKPVPMVPLNELPTHYESVVKRSAACLHVGFGKTNDTSTRYEISKDRFIPTVYLRYTWRLAACTSKCNYWLKLGWSYEQERNPCFLCANHIPPRVGGATYGDSGGPVTCDGYYMGPYIAGLHVRIYNHTSSVTYALHCVKDAITPERLAYYKTVPAEDQVRHNLGPVRQRRFLSY